MIYDIIGNDNVHLLDIRLCYLRSPVSCRVAERLVKLDCVAWVAYLKSSWQISGDRRKDNERVSRVRCLGPRGKVSPSSVPTMLLPGALCALAALLVAGESVQL